MYFAWKLLYFCYDLLGQIAPGQRKLDPISLCMPMEKTQVTLAVYGPQILQQRFGS